MRPRKPDNTVLPLPPKNGVFEHHQVVDLEAYQIAWEQYCLQAQRDNRGRPSRLDKHRFERTYEGVLALVKRYRDEEGIVQRKKTRR